MAQRRSASLLKSEQSTELEALLHHLVQVQLQSGLWCSRTEPFSCAVFKH